MLTLVTGAGGFVGQALARRMAETGYPGRVRLTDLKAGEALPGNFEWASANLAEPGAVQELVRGADRIIHLAALPGGAAERDPPASRRANLDALLALLEAAAAAGKPVRLVQCSSIAVFGHLPPAGVDDATTPRPASTYGAHKLMAEIALADAVRRGTVDALALRLPGIAARPRAADGFRSAFMSDVFHALQAGERYRLPVGPEATVWLMSARCCADNLIHAVACDLPVGSPRVLTLPALRTRMADLIAAIGRHLGCPTADIEYDPDPDLEAQFGSLPPLAAPAAEALGLCHDGDLDQLVGSVLGGIQA